MKEFNCSEYARVFTIGKGDDAMRVREACLHCEVGADSRCRGVKLVCFDYPERDNNKTSFILTRGTGQLLEVEKIQIGNSDWTFSDERLAHMCATLKDVLDALYGS